MNTETEQIQAGMQAEAARLRAIASSHDAKIWSFKVAALFFVFGGLIVAVIAIASGAAGATIGPLIASLLGAIVWLLADIADSVFQ